MTSLPTGTVTFLFTDVEGSTRLLYELGDDYADALSGHWTVLRDAFSRRGGVEVDTQGDAFFYAFARASDALAAARDGQAALDGQIRVHTGAPTRPSTERGRKRRTSHSRTSLSKQSPGRRLALSRNRSYF